MGFGGVIKLEGESEYRQALKRITTGLKEMDSEMKLVNSTVSKNDKSLSTLSQKNDILTRKLAAQNSKLAEAKTMLGQAETAYSKADKSVKEMADALDQAEKELDQAKSSGKATAEEIARLEANVSKAKANLDNANKTYNEADTTLKKWKTTVNSAEAEVNKTSQAIVKNANEMDKASKKVKEQDSAYSQLKTTINSQESELKKLSTQYANVVLEQGKNSTEAKELKAKMNSLNSELSENKSKLNEAENEARQYSSALNETDNAATDAKEGIGAMGVALGSLISQMAMRAVDKLKELATSTIEVGMSFDSAMSKVQAVSGATGKEYDTLKEKALQMGSSTKFTASEAAEAFNYMAMAGWKTGDMLDGIEPILNLAAAAGADLATTSDIVTDALTAMGYSAKDAGRLTDVMAAASSNANTNVELMGETFKYVAPVSGALGYSMEDLALGIGLMANAGIKGEQAGTSLRSVLTRLASPPKDAAEAMNELGISITNTDGTMKPLNQIIIELKKSFAGLNEQQKAQMANSIAGKNAMSGFLALVNGSDADFNKLSTAINNSSGAAAKMAQTMNDNLGGDLISLKSKFEGVQISIYKGLEPALRQGAQSLKSFLATKDWESFGKSVGEVLNKVVSGLQFLINHAGTVTTAMGVMLAAFAVSKINDFTSALSVTIAKLIATATATTAETGAVTAATVAQNLWNAALTANPIGIVIMGVAALAAGVIALTKAVQADKEAQLEAANARRDAAQESLEAMQEEANTYAELKTRIEEKAAADMANIANAQRLKDELMNLADANGVVAEGDRTRAEFILGQLNQALGTEYTMTGNQITNYQQLQSEVAKTIEAKKAEILFLAQEEAYANAIQNRSQAEQNATQLSQELVAQEQIVNNLREQMGNTLDTMNKTMDSNARRIYADKLVRIQEELRVEEDALKQKQGAYATNEETLRNYYKDIGTYETASQQLLEGKTAEAIQTLDRKNNAFMTAADVVGKSADEQKQILEKQVTDTELNAQLMEQRYKEGVSGVTQEMVNTARQQADQAKVEFNQIGGNITEGIAAGAEDKKSTLWTKISNLVTGALNAAKRAIDSHSPSRKFRDEIGKNISLGIAVGIEDKANVVNQAITDLTDNVSDIAEKSTDVIKEEADSYLTVTDALKNGAREQKKILDQQLKDTELHAKLMVIKYKAGVSGVAKEMVNTARLQALLAMIEFQKIGNNIVEGIAVGAENKRGFLYSTISSIIAGALAAARAAAAINSPSHKFRDEIGKNISLGIAEGITQEARAVTGAITNLTNDMLDSAKKGIPETTDLLKGSMDGAISSIQSKSTSLQLETPSIFSDLGNVALSGADKQAELVLGLDKLNSLTNKLNNIDRDDSSKYNKLVKAFESALSNMTVELDDEVAGKFIEKTVARAIYT